MLLAHYLRLATDSTITIPLLPTHAPDLPSHESLSQNAYFSKRIPTPVPNTFSSESGSITFQPSLIN